MPRKVWHITFGTYGTRLHGGARPTVHHRDTERDTPFVYADAELHGESQERMKHPPIFLNEAQRICIEALMPNICERGGWVLHAVSAATEGDHVHILLDADSRKAPERIMRWMKQWISEGLNEQFGKPISGTWWAKGGSTKPVSDRQYFLNVKQYVERQRTSKTQG